MRRWTRVALLTAIAGLGLSYGGVRAAGTLEDDTLVERLGPAYEVLLTFPDFTRAVVQGDQLALFAPDTTVTLVPMAGTSLCMLPETVVGIWKAAGDVYFVTSATPREVRGIGFSPDAQVSLDGVDALEVRSGWGMARVFTFRTSSPAGL